MKLRGLVEVVEWCFAFTDHILRWGVGNKSASAWPRDPRLPNAQNFFISAKKTRLLHSVIAKSENWPAFHVERRKVSDLKPFKNNARTHSKEQVAQIAASIKEWGWTQPVLVDETGGVLAGHGRLEAAASLGIAEVPVIVASGWSDAQKRAYVLADNQLALNAGWDENLLRIEIGGLGDMNFDIGLVGFTDEFLSDLFKTKDGKTEPDDIPAPEATAASQIGDVWLLGNHRIICGDSTDKATVAAVLGQDKPHLMVTDPPYGVEYDPYWREGVDLHSGKKLGKNGSGRAMGVVQNDDRADWSEAWPLVPGVVYVWLSGPIDFWPPSGAVQWYALNPLFIKITTSIKPTHWT